MPKICSRVNAEGAPCLNHATEKHPWCHACKARYQREYEAVRLAMAAEKGFRRGVEITRQMLAWEFARHGKRAFTGTEVASVVENAKRPAYQAVE